jgi:1-acyl-sn-glycerol-3-phosphate acyltransferase
VIQHLSVVLVALNTVIFGLPVILFSFLDRSGRIPLNLVRAWNHLNLLIYRLEVEAEGVERIPRGTPLVIMSNHQSMLDIAALVKTLPIDFRFVAKKELVRVPFFGWALWSSGQIIVDRQNRARSVASLRHAAERIRAGVNVIIFPEGTRSRDGRLGPFKSGGFHLAIQAQAPILPATVSGSHRISRKGSLRVRRGAKIKIHYGDPIPTRGLGIGDREMLKDRVRRAIERGYDPSLQPEAATAGRSGIERRLA